MAKHTAPGWLGDLQREEMNRARDQMKQQKRDRAACAMLAALQEALELSDATNMPAPTIELMRAAIAQAKAAGITS